MKTLDLISLASTAFEGYTVETIVSGELLNSRPIKDLQHFAHLVSLNGEDCLEIKQEGKILKMIYTPKPR